MLHKTRGIVLKLTNYAESSVLAQVFTEKFGLQSYMVHGARKPKSKIRVNMLQHMQLLDMVVYHKNNTSLQRIAEARPSPHFQTIPYEISKSATVLFLNEVLYKSLRHQGTDEYLFDFLHHSIVWLDAIERMPTTFPLYFLIKLTRYMGFRPGTRMALTPCFDLKEGLFCKTPPTHIFHLQEPHTSQFAALLDSQLDDLTTLKIPLTERRLLLRHLIDYYRLHIENMGEINAHEVLEEVLT